MTDQTTPTEPATETLSPVLRKLHEGLAAAYPGSSKAALAVARQLLADHARELVSAEPEAARIERELLAALDRSRTTHPDLTDAPERLGLLAALRIVQGDRFGAPIACPRCKGSGIDPEHSTPDITTPGQEQPGWLEPCMACQFTDAAGASA